MILGKMKDVVEMVLVTEAFCGSTEQFKQEFTGWIRKIEAALVEDQPGMFMGFLTGKNKPEQYAGFKLGEKSQKVFYEFSVWLSEQHPEFRKAVERDFMPA